MDAASDKRQHAPASHRQETKALFSLCAPGIAQLLECFDDASDNRPLLGIKPDKARRPTGAALLLAPSFAFLGVCIHDAMLAALVCHMQATLHLNPALCCDHVKELDPLAKFPLAHL